MNKPAARFAAAAVLTAVAFLAPLVGPSANYSGATATGTAKSDQLTAITSGRDCTPASEPRLVDRVVVSEVGTLVVREVAFDVALDLAQTGRVEVLAYCA